MDAPINVARIPLTHLFDFGGVAIRVDGTVTIGEGKSRSYLIPWLGFVLVPTQNGTIPVALSGNNELKSFSEIGIPRQAYVKALSDYFGFPYNAITQKKILTNYHYTPEGPVITGDPSGSDGCCCDDEKNKGKKTLIILIPGKFGKTKYLQDYVMKFTAEEKKCTEILTYGFDPDKCPKELAKELSNFYNDVVKAGIYCKVRIVAHCAGGLIAAYAAADMPGADIDTLATPYGGVDIGPVSAGFLWDLGYFFPPGMSLLLNATVPCLTKAAAMGGHDFLSTDSVNACPGGRITIRTHPPTSHYSYGSQNAWVNCATHTKYYPDADHRSIVPKALSDILKEESCTECGNGVKEDTEECDPAGEVCKVMNVMGNDGYCREYTSYCTDDCMCPPIKFPECPAPNPI